MSRRIGSPHTCTYTSELVSELPSDTKILLTKIVLNVLIFEKLRISGIISEKVFLSQKYCEGIIYQ